MAAVTLIISDDDDEGGVQVSVDFGPAGFDATSEAHVMAADMAMDLKEEGRRND